MRLLPRWHLASNIWRVPPWWCSVFSKFSTWWCWNNNSLMMSLMIATPWCYCNLTGMQFHTLLKLNSFVLSQQNPFLSNFSVSHTIDITRLFQTFNSDQPSSSLVITALRFVCYTIVIMLSYVLFFWFVSFTGEVWLAVFTGSEVGLLLVSTSVCSLTSWSSAIPQVHLRRPFVVSSREKHNEFLCQVGEGVILCFQRYDRERWHGTGDRGQSSERGQIC